MATVKLFLFVGKTYSSGESPILLRVTHQRKHKYIALGYSCMPNQWNKDKCRLKRNYHDFKAKNRVLASIEERAESILDEFKKLNTPFTFQSFEDRFRNNANSCTVYEFFNIRLKEVQKMNTRGTYQQTKNALLKFAPNNKLMFADIDYKFLKKFEAHLLGNGLSGGGVHFYMRTLRAIINEAISRDYLPRELYPFSNQFNKNGYSISHLKSIASPRALSDKDMNKIKNFPITEYPNLKKSLMYFLFSYYARGMNFTDMAQLEWTDIYNERIRYTRSKTSGSFNIKVSQPLKEILHYFKTEYSYTGYVFPVLNEIHQTETQIKNRVRKCLKQYNKQLKDIAKVLNIDIQLTSYVARHTYATTLKRNGIDTAIISEGLGHQDISTTKAYLQQFETETIDKADEVL